MDTRARSPLFPIRVGLAGWSYKDWEGIVYPSHGSKFDHLAYLAGFFDTIEVNSSFYRIPPPTHSKSWVRRVEANDAFRFTAKLFRGFTHEKEDQGEGAFTAFRDFLDPLVEANRLGALLVQYPWSTKASLDDLDRVRRTLDAFSNYPCALEVRHASFQNEDFLEELRQRNVGFVNIDQPLFSDSVKPSGEVTGGVAYIRLHGRNYQKWFSHEESWERYDYLYSLEELEPWVERANEMSKASEVFVITNNHFRGQAAVNAIELKRGLGQDAGVPGSLGETYPERL